MVVSLTDLVGKLEKRVNELRRAGDAAALLSAARDAADQIEHRVTNPPGDGEQREALMVLQRLTFNAAADCWPGWDPSKEPPNSGNLLAARELAQYSALLVERLELGQVRSGTGHWLVGAFDLALARYSEASGTFAVAHEHYVAANAPGLALLVEGYMALVREMTNEVSSEKDSLDQICAKISTGGFKDGVAWIAQLRTAREVILAASRKASGEKT
jgi:hypothetical protein